jgi:peptidyl-prolyl cis-trans isomerase B (cyclophilin B)
VQRLAATLILLVLAFAACGGDDQPASRGAPEPPPEASGGAAATGCEVVAAPEGRDSPRLSRPRTRLRSGQTYVATVATSCGEFETTLDPRRAPRTGGSFLSLARRGFYDGTTFHRIVPGFVIQGGDPEGTGTGGPGYSVVEAPPESLSYVKGVVAMAKTGMERPGTSGSQFFVVTGEDAQLPPEYALLGRVTAGLGVVDRIGVVPVGPDEKPIEPVVIQSVTVRAR